MNPLIAASLLSGLASNVGSFVSTAAANAQNVRLAEEQRAWNLRMFHLQNQYNHPSAQMRRLKDAGLNPNLVYDRGNVNVPSAVVSSSNAAQVSPHQFSFDPSMFINMKQLELDERRVKMEEKSNLIQRQLVAEQVRTEQSRQSNIEADTGLKEANSALQLQLHDFNEVMNDLNIKHADLNYQQNKVVYSLRQVNELLQNQKLVAEINTENVLRDAKLALFDAQAFNNRELASYTKYQRTFLEAVHDFRVSAEKWASQNSHAQSYINTRLAQMEALMNRPGVDALRILTKLMAEIGSALITFK